MSIKNRLINKWISQANSEGLYEIMRAVIRGFGQLNPKDELVIMSLSKNDTVQRERQIRDMAAFLIHQKWDDLELHSK